jgi:very-short-patch-repair endonuclease
MLAADDHIVVDGIPVTTVARTLLDLAGFLSPRHLGYALDRAERLQVFDLCAVDDALGRARGRRGASALREAIKGWRVSDTRSRLEDRHLELLSGAGLPMPHVNVALEGELHDHAVDAYWPSSNLVVELDSFDYHRTRRDRERDATTDADLELAGYRVLRLTWDDVTVHEERTVRRIRAHLR